MYADDQRLVFLGRNHLVCCDRARVFVKTTPAAADWRRVSVQEIKPLSVRVCLFFTTSRETMNAVEKRQDSLRNTTTSLVRRLASNQKEDCCVSI